MVNLKSAPKARIQIGRIIGDEALWRAAQSPRRHKVVKLRRLLRFMGAKNTEVKSATKAVLLGILSSMIDKNIPTKGV